MEDGTNMAAAGNNAGVEAPSEAASVREAAAGETLPCTGKASGASRDESRHERARRLREQQEAERRKKVEQRLSSQDEALRSKQRIQEDRKRKLEELRARDEQRREAALERRMKQDEEEKERLQKALARSAVPTSSSPRQQQQRAFGSSSPRFSTTSRDHDAPLYDISGGFSGGKSFGIKPASTVRARPPTVPEEMFKHHLHLPKHSCTHHSTNPYRGGSAVDDWAASLHPVSRGPLEHLHRSPDHSQSFHSPRGSGSGSPKSSQELSSRVRSSVDRLSQPKRRTASQTEENDSQPENKPKVAFSKPRANTGQRTPPVSSPRSPRDVAMTRSASATVKRNPAVTSTRPSTTPSRPKPATASSKKSKDSEPPKTKGTAASKSAYTKPKSSGVSGKQEAGDSVNANLEKQTKLVTKAEEISNGDDSQGARPLDEEDALVTETVVETVTTVQYVTTVTEDREIVQTASDPVVVETTETDVIADGDVAKEESSVLVSQTTVAEPVETHPYTENVAKTDEAEAYAEGAVTEEIAEVTEFVTHLEIAGPENKNETILSAESFTNGSQVHVKETNGIDVREDAKLSSTKSQKAWHQESVTKVANGDALGEEEQKTYNPVKEDSSDSSSSEDEAPNDGMPGLRQLVDSVIQPDNSQGQLD